MKRPILTQEQRKFMKFDTFYGQLLVCHLAELHVKREFIKNDHFLIVKNIAFNTLSYLNGILLSIQRKKP